MIYCLKDFKKNFLKIVKIYARKSIRRQTLFLYYNFSKKYVEWQENKEDKFCLKLSLPR